MLERVDARVRGRRRTHIEAVQLRAALQTAMAVAQDDEPLPRRARALGSDQARTATQPPRRSTPRSTSISGLATLFQPFMPFTSPRAWAMAGNEGDIEAAGWRRSPVAGGTLLPEPAPLFKKLDDSLVEEEEARLGS